MIDPAALLADAKGLVRMLVDDLRGNADEAVVDAELRAARAAGRTALPTGQWAEGLYAQVAVSWVLGCVFVRFCEDNGLVTDALLSGPGNRRDIAREHRAAYLRDHPAHDDRDWLREVFSRYRELPATGDLFGDHNPLWLLAPSADGVRELVQAFGRIDPDSGTITHDFTDPEWSTRFLGDLYQDLSEHAKKQYALLQTPVFVEAFILDHTLTPAIATFGLRDTDIIDPTCGSGHFLLGAFDRLFNRWVDAEPGTNPRELARRSVDAVAGVDINPFAVAIARFRLLVAALRAGGDRRLADAPTYPINIAVGDSLLHTVTQLTLDGIGRDDDLAAASAHGYATEDAEAARTLLSRQWAVVVGNPPYPTVKDPALNVLYRKRYKTCRGKYSLGVPFTERFWQLARSAPTEPDRAGYIGLITANSFMKREMGKDLIEEWLPTRELTHLIDTSGAYIPGHGTPTVILFGRSRRPVAVSVRAVMGILGEPTTPDDASKGLVWTSIVDHLDQPGAQTEYVSVVDLERDRLKRHPWSIGGGGAAELKERLDDGCESTLGSMAESIGFGAISAADDVFRLPLGVAERARLESEAIRFQVFGEDVRDWRFDERSESFFPYEQALRPIEVFAIGRLWLWPYRTILWARRTFSKTTYRDDGRRWWEWHQVSLQRAESSLLITFPYVATHNHFALSRGGRLFNSTAPVIQFAPNFAERDCLGLLGALNSSTACFWLKQVCFPKGGDQVGNEGARIRKTWWDERFAFDGTKLQAFPLPASVPGETAAALDHLASELLAQEPPVVAAVLVPSADHFAAARAEHERIRCKMIGLQEQLDWEAYRLYGLLDDDLTLPGGEPPLRLGQRAFEIVLARKVVAGEVSTTWFERHRSIPITDLPPEWPDDYRRLVERRIEVIESNPEIALIERPEYKRRWAAKPWDEQQADALRSWLFDRLESPAYWPVPTITSTARLASVARADEDFMTVARLYAGRDDVDVAALVAELVKAEAVPYLAALRYTDSGMRKYGQWCETWALQRREDVGEDVGEITVPPKYARVDFTGVAWTHRGKLDVAKERFISYPGAERENDPSLAVGWAGWDHLERARALATFYLGAKRDGRDVSFLTPLLAGLAELVPWLVQWYDEPSADPALDRPGTQIAALVDSELRALHLTADDLAGWRPAQSTRGRPRR